jgi:hypothetical protein
MVSALRVLLALNRCHGGKIILETVVSRECCEFLFVQHLRLLILAFILAIISVISAFRLFRGLTSQIVTGNCYNALL